MVLSVKMSPECLLVLLTLCQLSCSKSANLTSQPVGNSSTLENKNLEKDTSNIYAENQEPNLPSSATISVDDSFNKSAAELLVRPLDDEDKNKMFLLRRTYFYRPVWLDLRKDAWKDIPKNIGIFINPDEISRASASIYAPLRKSVTLGDLPAFSQWLSLPFHVLGHKALKGLESPKQALALLAIYGDDPLALKPPKDYEMIYQKAGTAPDDIQEVYERVVAAGQNHQMPSVVDTQILSTFLDGISTSTAHNVMDMDARITFSSSGMKLESFFAKQSVAIWKPIPPEGYKCLGYLATGGIRNQPYVDDTDQATSYESNVKNFYEQQASGGQFQPCENMATMDCAVYCVKKDYLSQGILGKMIASDLQEKVILFQVQSKDQNEGYDETGVFVAIHPWDGETDVQKLQEQMGDLWVLKKSFLKILPDLTLNN